MFNRITELIYKNKYELLFFALVQHLFIGIFLNDNELYLDIIWPINMIILGIGTIGVFTKKGKWENITGLGLAFLTLILPIIISFTGPDPFKMKVVCITYSIYFLFIFSKVMRYLIKPSYINFDIISASVCGYLLIIEITVFVLNYLFLLNPESLKGIDTTSPATVYMDIVYFSTILQTTIGFGDITPSSSNVKLVVSLFGILGQLYTVLLVGVLISKFTNK